MPGMGMGLLLTVTAPLLHRDVRPDAALSLVIMPIITPCWMESPTRPPSDKADRSVWPRPHQAWNQRFGHIQRRGDDKLVHQRHRIGCAGLQVISSQAIGCQGCKRSGPSGPVRDLQVVEAELGLAGDSLPTDACSSGRLTGSSS